MGCISWFPEGKFRQYYSFRKLNPVYSEGFGRGNQRLKLGGIFYPSKDKDGKPLYASPKPTPVTGTVVKRGGKRVDPSVLSAEWKGKRKEEKRQERERRKAVVVRETSPLRKTFGYLRVVSSGIDVTFTEEEYRYAMERVDWPKDSEGRYLRDADF